MDPAMMPFVWLGIALLASVLEASTAQLVSIWFVLGSIASAVSCIFTDNIVIQGGIFLLVSLLAIIVTRPFVRRITKAKPVHTNSDRYVGKIGKVIIEINNQAGQGQINVLGSIWSARSENNVIIPVGTEVKVEKIEGVKLIINPVKKVGVY